VDTNSYENVASDAVTPDAIAPYAVSLQLNEKKKSCIKWKYGNGFGKRRKTYDYENNTCDVKKHYFNVSNDYENVVKKKGKSRFSRGNEVAVEDVIYEEM